MAERSLGEVIDAIVRMPLDEGWDDSHVSLVEASGYMEHRGEIAVDDLYDRLARDPRLVDAWQTWSDDNRSSPAWFFASRGPAQFEVAHVDRRGERTERLMLDDRARACAEYVYREIEQTAAIAYLWRHHPWRLIRETVAWFREGWRDRER